MRVILFMILAASFTSLHAQTLSSFGVMDNTQSLYSPRYPAFGNGHALNKNWSLSTYGGLSAGFGFFNGNYASFVSAPFTAQINRRLNNNLYAFAGVTAAPTYFNFNTFSNTGINKGFGNPAMFNPNNLRLYSSVGAGLMYINDERTFSISGSISVDRGGYSMYPYGTTSVGRPPTLAGTWK